MCCSINHGFFLRKQVVCSGTVVGLIVFQTLDHILPGVPEPASLSDEILINNEFLIEILANLLVPLDLLQLVDGLVHGLLTALLLPAVPVQIQLFLRLLLRRLRELVEHPVVQMAVIVHFIVLIDFSDPHPELEHHVLLDHEFLHGVRQLVALLQVGTSGVEGRQDYGLGGQVPEQGVLSAVQVAVREVEGLVHVRLQLLVVLVVDELLLDGQFLPVVEDRALVHRLQPRVLQHLLQREPLLRVPRQQTPDQVLRLRRDLLLQGVVRVQDLLVQFGHVRTLKRHVTVQHSEQNYPRRPEIDSATVVSLLSNDLRRNVRGSAALII